MEKSREFQKNIYFCFDYAKAFDYVDHNKLWKIKETGVPDHLTYLLRNLYFGQEAAIRTRYGTRGWLQVEKGLHQAVYCHPAYLISMQRISCEILGKINHKLQSRLPGEYQQPRICRWHHSNSRKWRGTKEPLEGERWEWKRWVKNWNSTFKKWRSCICFIISWQIDGKSVSRNRFYFLGLQNHCRRWLQSWNEKIFAPWKTSYDKLR